MNRRLGLLLILVLLAAVVVVLRREEITDSFVDRQESGEPATGGQVPATDLRLVSRYSCEEHWIVTSVCEDIAGMLSYARQYQAVPQSTVTAPSLRIQKSSSESGWLIDADRSAGPGRFELNVNAFVWSPETYEGWAKLLLDEILAAAPADSEHFNGDPMSSLTDLRVEAIESQNVIVSQWLQSHPLDAAAHEGAALVLAAFAMRETSGTFFDQRWSLNRIAAHLAIARALRQTAGFGRTGGLADLSLRVLVGRQAEAAAMLGTWMSREGLSASEISWVNALALRNDSDWRKLEDAATGSLMERIEYFRAVVSHVGDGFAMKRLKDESVDEIPDWGRILLMSGTGVQIGHFATEAVRAWTIQEIATIYRLRFGREPGVQDLPKFLNAVDGSAVWHEGNALPAFQVIDDGAWGRFEQRHLCAMANQVEWFMRHRWGVEEAAERFRKEMDPLLGQLTYFPIVQKLRAQNQGEYQKGMSGSAMVVRAHPEWVSDYNWALLRDTTKFTFVHVIPYCEPWFRPEIPTGTAYNTAKRLGFPAIARGPASRLEPLLQLAPNDVWIARRYVEMKSNGTPTADEYRERLGPFLEYDLGAMRVVADASRDDLEQSLPIMERICEYDPDWYFAMGARLAKAHRDDEAAVAYQKGVDLGEDRVNAANLCEWLVNYYYDHGKQEEAMKVARMAASAYSYYGLETLLKLYERMDRIDEAEEIAKLIEKRYDSPDPRAGLYHRQIAKGGGPVYAERFEEIVEKIFPSGLEKVTLSSFASPPADGLVTYGESKQSKEIGLQSRAVIVAVDGIRVRNRKQFDLLNRLTYSEDMSLIVWQGGRYQEIKAHLWRRIFNVELKDYQGRS